MAVGQAQGQDSAQGQGNARDSAQDSTQTIPSIEKPEPIFIVEDGTLVKGANSYVTVEDAISYNISRGRDKWGDLSSQKQSSALVKATQYIDGMYRWKGRRKFESQELAFPRVMIRDIDGFEVTGIPKKLKDAVCEAAYKVAEEEEELFTQYDANGDIKRQRVEGAVEVEFFNKKESSASDRITRWEVLDAMLRGLYEPKLTKTSINAHAAWAL